MVTSNERKGSIAIVVLLSALVLIVVCTQRCGSEPESGVNAALADTVAVANDSVGTAVSDSVIHSGKYQRKRRRSKQKTSNSSYKERDPLAEEEYVNR